MQQTTICALATGAGGAVAVVRLSGPLALELLTRVTHAQRSFTPRYQTLCTIYDGNEVLDKALVTYFQAPHSFTGEDVVEFALHASAYIKGRLLEILCEMGAVPARRGEFSQRAFFNGKMDLLEAQGLCDLIASGNKAAHRLAMNSLDGRLTQQVDNIKQILTSLLAQIEVRLDDVDEEMTPLPGQFIEEELRKAIGAVSRLTDTFSVGKLIKEGLKVAIVGVPNSGKSSLLNALVGFSRAIVADACGTTRDTVEESLEINGQKVILTDTAGIREHALDPAEQEGMRRSKCAMEAADVILMVSDISQAASAEEEKLWQDVQAQQKRIIIVQNKSDKQVRKTGLDNSRNYPVIAVSCKTGDGLQNLKNELTREMENVSGEGGIIISNLRHYEALLRGQTELESALLQLQQDAGGEIYAEHIRLALRHLQDLVGQVTPDDVLDIIFAKFCMGK